MGFSQCGEIYSHDVSIAQASVGTSYVKLATFVSNGEENGCVNDKDANEITAYSTGYYQAVFAVSFSGNDNTVWEFDIAINDVVQQKGTTRKTVLAAEVGATAFSSILRLNWGDVVTIYVKADGAGKTLTVQNCSLTIMS